MENTEVLQEISSKLEIINISLRELINVTQESKSELLSAILSSVIKVDMPVLPRETIVDVGLEDDSFENVASDIMQSEREAYKIRQMIIRIWQKSQNERKQSYWNYLKFLNTGTIYETWVGKDTPVLPRKYRIHRIPGEPHEDEEIRKESTLHRFESDIKIMKNKSRRYELSYMKIDDELFSVIDQKSEGVVCETLKEIWRRECEKEERRSLEIWMKKQAWLHEYEQAFGSSIFTEDMNEIHTSGRRKSVRRDRQVRNYSESNMAEYLREHSVNHHSTDKIHNTRRKPTFSQIVSNHYSTQNRPKTEIINSRKQKSCNRNRSCPISQKGNYTGRKYTNRSNSDRVIHRNGTTYIGQNVRQSFLGQFRSNRDRGGGTNKNTQIDPGNGGNSQDVEQTYQKEIY